MRLVLSLFALALAVAATVVLVNVIFPHFSAWNSAQSWVQVDAKLIDHQLTATKSEVTNSDDQIQTVYENNLTVNYRYWYKDKEYQGNRLAINGVKPSDQFFYKWKREFDLADTASKVITVWVNPKNVNQSTVSRGLRLRGLDFFIALFIGTAVLGYSGVIEILRSIFFFINPRIHTRLRKKLAQNHTKTVSLHDRDSPIAPVGWGLVLLLLLPIYLGGFRFALLNLIDGEIVLGLVPLILGGVFIGILFYVGAKVRSKKIDLGAVRLVIDNYPLRVGERLSGFCKVRTSKLPATMATAQIKVGCHQHDHRKAETRKKRLWADTNAAEISRHGMYSHVLFDFEIPDDLPSAENDKAVKVDWWLELNVDGYKKEMVSKRYDNLGVFQTDSAKLLARENRLKNNVVTRPSLLDFSTIFTTNGALLIGVLFFGSSVITTLLGILVETALIALLSPLLMIGLQSRTGQGSPIKAQPGHEKSKASAISSVARVIRMVPFVVGLLVFQFIVVGHLSDLQFTDLVTNNGGVLLALLDVLVTYNLWLPIIAVFISIFFEWRKLSKKSATTNIDKLMTDIASTPTIRMFFTTFLMVVSMGFLLNREDGLQIFLFTILGFKIWGEYSLMRWGRLEV